MAIIPTFICLALPLAAGTLVLLSGCGAPTPAQPKVTTGPTPPAVDSSFTLVLSGDTAGFIVPCGCTTKQFGGLPRRATYLKTIPNAVYLDAGGTTARGTEYDELKLQYLWKGMLLIKPAALNIGAGELTQSAKGVTEVALWSTLHWDKASEPVPVFLATNVVPDALPKSKSWIEPDVGGIKAAIVGVCSSSAHTGQGWLIEDPKTALRRVVPELAKSHDIVILLAYADEATCMDLIAEFPEISIVLAAGTGQPIAPKMVQDRTIFASTAQKGKFLAQLTVSGHRNAWKLASGKIVELDESIKDDPDQLKNLALYKAALKEKPLDPSVTGEAPALLKSLPAGYRYAGNRACAECHTQDNVIYATTHHAAGLKTLHEKDFDFDPYCLKCHTTGYGAPGGFVNANKTPELGGIGCESCHGPSQAHAANPRKKTTAVAVGSCVTCHDPENSPKFNYLDYYQRILHGKVKATQFEPKER